MADLNGSANGSLNGSAKSSNGAAYMNGHGYMNGKTNALVKPPRRQTPPPAGRGVFASTFSIVAR